MLYTAKRALSNFVKVQKQNVYTDQFGSIFWFWFFSWIFINAFLLEATCQNMYSYRALKHNLTLEFDQPDTMQAQLNVKLTVEWTIGYTTDLRHTYPIELRIRTSFYWGFFLCYSDFLNITQNKCWRLSNNQLQNSRKSVTTLTNLLHKMQEILLLKGVKANFQIDLILRLNEPAW